MPYKINKVYSGTHKGQYRLAKVGYRKALGFHATREKALKQIQAIEINKRK
jgi:hypothetical protein